MSPRRFLPRLRSLLGMGCQAAAASFFLAAVVALPLGVYLAFWKGYLLMGAIILIAGIGDMMIAEWAYSRGQNLRTPRQDA